jgi:hypothetical protein
MVEIGDILVLVCASGRAVRLSGPILSLYNFKCFKALLPITPPPHYIIAYYALHL